MACGLQPATNPQGIESSEVPISYWYIKPRIRRPSNLLVLYGLISNKRSAAAAVALRYRVAFCVDSESVVKRKS